MEDKPELQEGVKKVRVVIIKTVLMDEIMQHLSKLPYREVIQTINQIYATTTETDAYEQPINPTGDSGARPVLDQQVESGRSVADESR